MVGVMRRMVGAVLVGCALVLGGCGGASPAPEPLPSATAEPSAPEPPTPAPTPSASAVARPERPADMDRTDEVGAAAAAEYFLSLYSYVMQTGDLAEWDAMSWESCNFCSGIRDLAVEIAAKQENYQGGAIEAIDVFVFPRDEALDVYPVDVTYVQDPDARTDKEGALVNSTSGDAGKFGVDARRVVDQWKILAVSAQDQ